MSRRQTITPSKLQVFIEDQKVLVDANSLDFGDNSISFPTSPDDSQEAYDMDIMSDLVWNLTNPSIPQEDKIAIAEDIETLSEYPQEALLQITERDKINLNSEPIDNNAKRNLLLSLKSYLTKMNEMKEKETTQLYQSTGCRTFRDQTTGYYVYREEESGTIISEGEYAKRYGDFVENRRNDRWIECISKSSWFRESNISTTPPSHIQNTISNPDVLYSEVKVSPKMKSKRKTLSPTQIKNWMHSEPSPQKVDTIETTSEALKGDIMVTSDSKSPQDIYEAEIQRAEEILNREFESALDRFRLTKQTAKAKLTEAKTR